MSATLATRPVAAVFQVNPLSPRFAAEVVGLDLCQPLDPSAKDAIYDAFVRFHVLCFRDQHLNQDDQVAFSQQFGVLERHTLRNRGKLNTLVHVVSNLGQDEKPSGKVKSTGWHTDKSFRPEPSLATILHAVTMPPEGGDTVFADMSAAYDALPEFEKRALDGVRVIHSWELSREHDRVKPSAEEIAEAPPHSHPMVRVHPDTGRKSLFMGQHCSHIDGRLFAEGRARIEALEDHATQEQFTYRHKWCAGDLLMWDNRCLLHRADPNFDAAQHPRVLHRTCLRGTTPL
jgi:alpha-ketoglutarate-dependent taurine dioxygenase